MGTVSHWYDAWVDWPDPEPEWLVAEKRLRWYWKDEEAVCLLPYWGRVFPHDFLLLPVVLFPVLLIVGAILHVVGGR